MAGTGFHSVVANRAQMCTGEHGTPRNLGRRLPQRKKSFFGLPEIFGNFRAVCQGVNPIVTKHGIGARFATTD
jgi:hypothetical protein